MKNPILDKVSHIVHLCNPSDENEEGNTVDWFEPEKFDKLLDVLDNNPEISVEELTTQYYKL